MTFCPISNLYLTGKTKSLHIWATGSASWSFPGASDSKKFTCNAEDPGLIPGSGRTPGEWNGYPFEYSCWENSTEEPGGLYSSWDCQEPVTTEFPRDVVPKYHKVGVLKGKKLSHSSRGQKVCLSQGVSRARFPLEHTGESFLASS